MLFELVRQGKNKTVRDSKTSMTAKPSTTTAHRIDNFAPDSDVSIIHLQRAIGNQAVQRLMQSKASFDFAKIGIEPKLEISQPGDPHEQEADRFAEQVMEMSAPNGTWHCRTK